MNTTTAETTTVQSQNNQTNETYEMATTSTNNQPYNNQINNQQYNNQQYNNQQYNNQQTTTANNGNRKKKSYRNRPSVRQMILEILSFLLLLAAGPAFLGGVISIFVCFFTLVLGFIGLFAWTRRHALLFCLLALAVIALCIVNIILRSMFIGQCMPYFGYEGQFDSLGLFVGGYGLFNDQDGGDHHGNNNDFRSHHSNNSIWCGNRKIVYITHAIILSLSIPAFFVSLSLLLKRNLMKTRTSTQTTTQTTKTRQFVTAN